MNTDHRTTIALLAAGLLLLGGCATPQGADVPQETTKYTLESTEKFAQLDKATAAAVTCTGLQERSLPDGRLEVVASVKNVEDRDVKVQINCVFKDEQGFHVGDETPFQAIVLEANATEAVRFTAATPAAKKYTIRVRLAR